MLKNNDNTKPGYGNPPKHAQFKPGQSGNPKGRPKGRKKSPKAILDEILQRPVKLVINGKDQTLTMLEAIYLRLANDALKGEKHALNVLSRLLHEYGFDKDLPEGMYGVLRVSYPATDSKEWSRRAQEHQRIAAEIDRRPTLNAPEAPKTSKPEESMNQANAIKPKRPRVRLVEAKKQAR